MNRNVRRYAKGSATYSPDDAHREGDEFRRVLKHLPDCLRAVYDAARPDTFYALGEMARESLAARDRGEPSPVRTPAAVAAVREFIARLERAGQERRERGWWL